MTDNDTVRVRTDGNIAVFTLNRPEVHNAINAQVQAGLRAAFESVRDDPEVGAVIITGAGDASFAAGADIGQLRDYDLRTGLTAAMQGLYDLVEGFEKPTIAAVNGNALGGGCELAMACDIRIASDTARFGLPETTLSVLPGAGGTQRLARLIGVGRALEMVLTGRAIRADEALAAGLVTSVVPADQLLDRARSIAERVLSKGPVATRLAKLVVRAGMDADQSTGLLIERLAQTVLYTTQDKSEGASAFLDKRDPQWSGR